MLAAMPAADLAVFSKSLVDVDLTRGGALYEPGDIVDSLYFPGSACVSVSAVMANGATVECSTVGRESAVGLLDAITGEATQVRYCTQVPGSGMRLPSAIFRRRLAESPALMALTLAHVRTTALQTEQGAACNAAHDVHARLARWLLMIQDRTGADSFSLTQENMAVMTGVQRSTISIVAAGLKRAGVIRYSRGALTILDREALHARACECYGVVGGAFDRLRRQAEH